MASVRDLALDEQLAARVFAAERRLELSQPEPETPPLPDEEGLVSAAARRRDALYRRSLICADVLAAGGALFFAIDMVAGGSVRLALVAAIPVVILLGKLLGLYDRDENVFHKSTLDEAPQHFMLAITYTLVVWFMAPWLMDGTFTRGAGAALLAASFFLTALLRSLARSFARRVGPLDRVLI